MSDFSTAKQDILEWARRPGAMKKFTTHDVYDAIHSIEKSTIASDALRRLFNHDKVLDREEFMDGNKKKFVYWLKEEKPEDIIISNEDKTKLPYMQVTETTLADKGNVSINQQIEIPNNFVIELKTPNGFTITIKACDLIK